MALFFITLVRNCHPERSEGSAVCRQSAKIAAPVPAPWSPYRPPPRRSRISRVRALVLILVLLPALPAPADVIHLKNGRTISADQVRESKNKDRVEYDLGEDSYAIPKSSVERIDTGGAAPVDAGASTGVPDISPAAPS